MSMNLKRIRKLLVIEDENEKWCDAVDDLSPRYTFEERVPPRLMAMDK